MVDNGTESVMVVCTKGVCILIDFMLFVKKSETHGRGQFSFVTSTKVVGMFFR
jgi:hypothetical protein